MLLNKKLESIKEELEEKEAQIGEILVASNLDPESAQKVIWSNLIKIKIKYLKVNKKLEEVLENKNSIIKSLKYDVAKLSKAHNDLYNVYEAKLAEYGILSDDLGFKPLLTESICKGPANLVSRTF